MIGQLQRQWLDALKSGEYQQGTKFLCKDGKYCCLGVACEVLGIDRVVEDGIVCFDGMIETLNQQTKDRLGLINASILMFWNDTGVSFEEIAKRIETNPGDFFEEAK